MQTDTWHDVLDSLDLAVCAVDRELRVILCNRTWDVLAHTTGRFDLQSDRLLGRSFLETLSEFDRQRWSGICARLLDGEEVNGTKWGVWSDPLNPDTDGDGIQDDCDPFPNSPAGDNEGDGVADDLDSDDDNDGWSDSYETGTSGTDPLNPDSDCDGIPDSLDTGGADTTPPVITIIEPVEGALP